MSIRTRILLFLGVMAFAIVGTGAVLFMTLNAARNHLREVEEAHQQLEAMDQLAIHANRYSEQIAEVLLLGEVERPDFDGARAQVKAALATLEERTRRQAVSADETAVRAREQRDLERVRRMRVLFDEVDSAAEQVFGLDRQSRRIEAIALFRGQIENRLDAEFEQMIATAMAEERSEVTAVEDSADRLSRWLAIGATSAFVGLLAITLAAGYLLARSLIKPIEALTAGAAALGRGDLEHRIPHDGRSELALLSRRFNEMAGELQARRANLVDASAELERVVAQRTEQLEHANERLTALDRLRVQFLGEISHELRTPLTVLRGEAEVTLRGGSKPVAVYRDTLVRIAEQAVEMGRLVDDLLFLARSEADQVVFEWSVVSLVDVLADALREGAVLASQNGTTITHRPPKEPVLVDADPRRLKQAIVIVLDNAVKYSAAGQAIDVWLSMQDTSAEIAVRDRGLGIPGEDLPYVFERFYRGGNAKTLLTRGSGLGLPIAKWIVGKHRGTIGIESEPGRKTQVTISLPVRRRHVGQNAAR